MKCPVCNKENNDEEYCTDCGTKLVDIKNNLEFEFIENKELSDINELHIYFKQLNEKINQQNKYLDKLNNDPLIKKYESISKINDENNELKTKIKELEQNNDKISSDLKKQKKQNSKLRSEINNLKNDGTFAGVIKGIFGSNKTNRSDSKFCPNCGHKLS